MSSSQQCPHSDLHFDLHHHAMLDANIHYLEIKARCKICNTPMCFRGMPLGISPQQPTMSLDGQEVRLPFLGEGEEPQGNLLGFTGEMHTGGKVSS